MNLTEVAVSGPVLIAVLLSLAAGAVSFASPCVVPLVPGYLAYLAGLVGAEAPAVTREEVATQDAERRAAVTGAVATVTASSVLPKRRRWRVAGAAMLFVAGFTVVFVLGLGSIVWAADALVEGEELLQRIGGVITVAMGLVFVGLVPWLQRDLRSHRVPRAGLVGAPLLGATFGLGWTPCLGPTLTGVVALASGTGGSGWRGVVLVLAYCVGLGVPFVFLALGAGRAVRAQAWLREHSRTIQLVGGVALVLVGLALATGLWGELIAALREPVAGFSTPL